MRLMINQVEKMSNRTRKTFSPEYRLECAQLVVDQGYSVIEAAKAMNVGKSAMDKQVRQLRSERAGKCPTADGRPTEDS